MYFDSPPSSLAFSTWFTDGYLRVSDTDCAYKSHLPPFINLGSGFVLPISRISASSQYAEPRQHRRLSNPQNRDLARRHHRRHVCSAKTPDVADGDGAPASSWRRLRRADEGLEAGDIGGDAKVGPRGDVFDGSDEYAAGRVHGDADVVSFPDGKFRGRGGVGTVQVAFYQVLRGKRSFSYELSW